MTALLDSSQGKLSRAELDELAALIDAARTKGLEHADLHHADCGRAQDGPPPCGRRPGLQAPRKPILGVPSPPWTLTLALSLVMPFAAVMLPSWFAVAVPWLDAACERLLRRPLSPGRRGGAIRHRGRMGMRGDRPPGSPGFRRASLRRPVRDAHGTPAGLLMAAEQDSPRSSRHSRSPCPRIPAHIRSMHLGRLAAYAAASACQRLAGGSRHRRATAPASRTSDASITWSRCRRGFVVRASLVQPACLAGGPSAGTSRNRPATTPSTNRQGALRSAQFPSTSRARATATRELPIPAMGVARPSLLRERVAFAC